MRIFLCIIFICFSILVFSQNKSNLLMEGLVVDMHTNEPIAYANVYNKQTQKGTICNNEGYFKINLKSFTDTIIITFVGYKNHILMLNSKIAFYKISLNQSNHLLTELTIKPKDDSYLYDILLKCKNKKNITEVNAKAYFELKSYINYKQIELLEGFYNIKISGYDVKNLQLKAGRLAIQPSEYGFFASLESSRAIAMLSLLNQNTYFPNNPFELNRKNLKKHYALILENQYLNDLNDSIMVIKFSPYKNAELFFKGTIWINKLKSQIIKINLVCNYAKNHPFLPLFSTDKILNVRFNITKTFKEVDGKMLFNHINFTYVVDYKSRDNYQDQISYPVKTTAVLYPYQYYSTFSLPKIEFEEQNISDYRKLNAMPYNNFFWSYNNENKLSDPENLNEQFYNDSNSFTNNNIFDKNKFNKAGFFEHPYIRWSEKRLIFKDAIKDNNGNNNWQLLSAKKYNFSTKIFVDIDTYNDSTNIITAAIFDPYESFCYLTIDPTINCVVNMYFDICEIERRNLEKLFNENAADKTMLFVIYNQHKIQFDLQKKQFLNEVELGFNQKAMNKWNAFIYSKLKIDNLEFFGIKQ